MDQQILDKLNSIEQQIKSLNALIIRVDEASVRNFSSLDRSLKKQIEEVKTMIRQQ